MAKRNNVWFEITTDQNDPSRVTMRRLKDEEIPDAIIESWQKELQGIENLYTPLLKPIDPVAFRELFPDERPYWQQLKDHIHDLIVEIRLRIRWWVEDHFLNR